MVAYLCVGTGFNLSSKGLVLSSEAWRVFICSLEVWFCRLGVWFCRLGVWFCRLRVWLCCRLLFCSRPGLYASMLQCDCFECSLSVVIIKKSTHCIVLRNFSKCVLFRLPWLSQPLRKSNKRCESSCFSRSTWSPKL